MMTIFCCFLFKGAQQKKSKYEEVEFETSFSPFIPLANTITGNTKYQLVKLAAVAGLKCAFVVIVGVFKRMGPLQQPEIASKQYKQD